MTHRTTMASGMRKDSLFDSAQQDAVRIETMHRRAAAWADGELAYSPRCVLSEQLVEMMESSVAVGSGEYLMDVYIGTLSRFRMIIDTGSDLNWL
jgi:hypothetical protein